MRLIAACLAAIMLVALFAGCDSSKKGGSSSAGNAPDTIKVGYVTPMSGPLAAFSMSIQWVLDMALPKINADGGIYIKEYDKKIPVEFILADSESNPSKAAEAAQNLITQRNVDILCGAWTPDTTIPVANTGEKNSVPTLLENSPMESWLEGGPYEWSYAIMFSVPNMMETYFDAWDRVDTNKKIGFIFDNNVDGVVMAPIVAEIAARRGYTVVDPGRFPMSTPDYSSMINQFKQEDCDIIVANAITPDYAVFLQQFYQMGFMPKVMTVGKALHFESDALTVGSAELANGLMTEIHWDREFPYSSPLLGMGVKELCDKWEAEHDSPYPTSIAYDITCVEIVTELLNKAQTLDKEVLRDTIPTLNADTIYGKINFESNHVFEVPCVVVQYILGARYPLEKNIIAHGKFGDIPVSNNPIVIMNERNL